MLRVLTVLFATLACQAANADVRQINRGGPTCDPTFKACILVIQIAGEIKNTVSNLENTVSTKSVTPQRQVITRSRFYRLS